MADPQTEKQDREALARLQQDTKIYPALQRLLSKLNEDAITKWTREEGVKKAWLKGYRECLDDFRGAVEQMALDAQDDAASEQHGKEILASDEAFGASDLAIA